MERLTRKFVQKINGRNEIDVVLPAERTVQEAVNRLAELEDKIENGTLVELPCKVGDTVYVINYPLLKHREYKVKSIAIHKSDIFFVLTNDLADRFNINNNVWLETVSINTFKQDWFLAREEAEKRLEELKR